MIQYLILLSLTLSPSLTTFSFYAIQYPNIVLFNSMPNISLSLFATERLNIFCYSLPGNVLVLSTDVCVTKRNVVSGYNILGNIYGQVLWTC